MVKAVFLFLAGGVLCGLSFFMELNVAGAIQEIEAILIGFCGLMLVSAGCVIDELSKILSEVKKD